MRYYGSDPEREWRRLETLDTGLIEFELTTRRLAKNLEPGSRVLDIGGGPGRYAIWLAENGHLVTLADLVPELLAVARRRIATAAVGSRVEEVVVADACNLMRWPEGSFDAALCLGPFYHLPEAERREQAARELARVIRPGGLAFVAFMPRLNFLRRAIVIPEERHHLRNSEYVNRVLEHGAFYNDAAGRFDAGYGARPEEIGPFFASFGLEFVTLVAIEGFSPPAFRELLEIAETDRETYAAALDLLEQTADEPSILGTANHLLYIGRKR
ncbi:MAG: class I SAM-dependent methyltransferase [Tepidiformaceae bacterium]